MPRDLTVEEQITLNASFEIIVQCNVCGKEGDYRDIPLLDYPDGTSEPICGECWNKRYNPKKVKKK